MVAFFAPLVQWLCTGPENFDTDAWELFLSNVAGSSCIFYVLGSLLILGYYNYQARRLLIREPKDLFANFKPLRVLWLSWVVGVVAAITYLIIYLTTFGAQSGGFFYGMTLQGIWIGLLTWSTCWLLVSIPCLIARIFSLKFAGLTPTRYRYRPIIYIKWL